MTKFVGEAAMTKLWELMKSWVTKKLTDGSVTRVGTASVGRSTQPMYLDAGTPKAVTTFVVGTQTAATNGWTGSVPGLTAYYDGLTIDYYLPFAGTSSAATLNLNSLGACKVWNGRGRSNTTTHFPQYSIIRLTYYGGAFYASAYYDSNSVYLSAMCCSSASTKDKYASASSFYPYAGVFMMLTMNTANTYSGKMTLNVNGRGAKDLWINGKVSSADNCTLPVGTYPCYYDGSVWHLYTDGRMRVKTLQADAVQANDMRMVYPDGTSSAVATMDDIDGVLSAAATMNGNDLLNEGNNLAMGGIVEWAGTQSASVTVKNSSTSSVAGVYLYNGKLIAKGSDGNWYGNWQDSGRWGDTAEDGGWQPSKNVVYRLSGSNTLWRWSGTAMERMLIAADSATNLSSSAGSSTQPVYFSGGKPVACTMQTTMNALCNALSTGTSTPTDNDYYICQYAGGGTSTTSFHRRPTSALYAYLKGKMDALYAKASHTHSYLPLAGGTMTGTPIFSNGTRIHNNGANAGTSGYLHLCQIKILGTYCNQPINIGICRRNDLQVTDLIIYFNPANNKDPSIGSYTKTGVADVYLHKSAESTWDLYVKKTEAYDSLSVLYYYATDYMRGLISVTFGTTMLTALPDGYLTFGTRTVTENATSSAKLATARTINGTSFDGSGNITTAKWGTARAVKIGNTSKNVDGSAALTWTLAEIGAAASGHNHDSSYAAKSHNHDSSYAASGHNHDSSYAAKSHTHSIGNVSGLQTSLDGKLNKTTYEVNTELQMGSSGKVCLGKYTCGDSNITIEIASTEASTYHGTLVVATQNITSSGGGTYTAKVYGDADGALTPLIKIQRSGAVFAVYADLPTYSKNLIHARCSNPAAAPTDIATQVSAIPSAATIKPDNALGRFATASSVSSISSTVSGHTTQLSDLNLRTVQHSDKSIVCTTATAPDAQGRLVGKTGFYAGQAVYMGVQATYVFFAATDTTGTLVIYGQGVGTKGGGTMANQIMYSRTAANAWAKLG